MKKKRLSNNWYFKMRDASEYQQIDLPHDYAIKSIRTADAAGGPSNAYFHGGVGRYVRYFTPDPAPHCILDIDGAYMCARIECNENQLAMHPHGYTPFLVDLSRHIVPGVTNKIAITTNALQPSTRWYSGAGIYRDVFLWTGGIIRIEPWDTFITTLSTDTEIAQIQISYQVTSDVSEDAELRSYIVDATGQVITRCTQHIVCTADSKTNVLAQMEILMPHLWDTDNPYLYNLRTEIWQADTLLDESHTRFGVRTISVSAEQGLLLNGHEIKLRGGCIHHDHGAVGAASFPASERRKIKKLKALGFNAIRTSHNPPSLALLEVCDELGMLLMDEAFDMWNHPQTLLDYHLWFADWCERDISYMVCRDRNHPCVISYSIGNEISERDGNSDGAIWSQRLTDAVRKYDATRPVTAAVCSLWGRHEATDPEDYCQEIRDKKFNFPDPADESWLRMTQDYMRPLDIVGYNYQYLRYEKDHLSFPNRIMWGSETHVLNFYDSWQSVCRNKYVLGDFTWTAIDNLGEAGAGQSLWARDGYLDHIVLGDFPWRTNYQGDMDLCGFRRPQSYFREAIWTDNAELQIFTTHPEHFGESFSGTGWHWQDVLDSWSFEDCYIGRPVKCEIYTTADRVDWSLNGQFVCSSIPSKAIATADIIYQPGTLTAKVYRNDVMIGETSLLTVGKPMQLCVQAENETLIADNRDLCYLDISILDAENNRVPDASVEVFCQVTGGELLAIFSGTPSGTDDFASNHCHTFHGRALAVIRTNKAGTVNVFVYGNNIASSVCTVKALPQSEVALEGAYG